MSKDARAALLDAATVLDGCLELLRVDDLTEAERAVLRALMRKIQAFLRAAGRSGGSGV